MSNEIIENFYRSIIERLSVIYQDEIWNKLNDLPSPVISFNNVELLKKAQLYVRHTDRLFGKFIANLFCSLLEEKGIEAKCAEDRLGRCLFVKQLKSRFHFFPLERFAGFPNVPWFKGIGQSINSAKKDILDIYIVLIREDKRGSEYVKRLNKSLCNQFTDRFFTLEHFVKNMLGETYWRDVCEAFENIQNASEQFQWFELSNVCNFSNMHYFEKDFTQSILDFDYVKEMQRTSLQMKEEAFSLIGNNFFNRGYQYLFSFNDVRKALLTSEWLFQNQAKDNDLDKTYIIAGYVKSVEQLLYHVISSLDPTHAIALMNNKTKAKEMVPVNSEALFNATLGNMVYFLKDIQNKDIFVEGIDSDVIQCMISIINRWVYKERNGYFHKHLLCDMKKVYQIRNRTFLLYFFILGGIRM